MRKNRLLFLGTALLSLMLVSCGTRADVRISKELYKDQVSSSHETERIPVVINKNSGTYHLDEACVHASRMAEENQLIMTVPDISYLLAHGYAPCKTCSDTDIPT